MLSPEYLAGLIDGEGYIGITKRDRPTARLGVEFIRPHQALEGLTPSEKAGMNLNLGKNKWLTIIRKSSK